MLALRDGKLFAVLTKLGDLHGDKAGQWFVETVYNQKIEAGRLFLTLADFQAHVAQTSFHRYT